MANLEANVDQENKIPGQQACRPYTVLDNVVYGLILDTIQDLQVKCNRLEFELRDARNEVVRSRDEMGILSKKNIELLDLIAELKGQACYHSSGAFYCRGCGLLFGATEKAWSAFAIDGDTESYWCMSCAEKGIDRRSFTMTKSAPVDKTGLLACTDDCLSVRVDEKDPDAFVCPGCKLSFSVFKPCAIGHDGEYYCTSCAGKMTPKSKIDE